MKNEYQVITLGNNQEMFLTEKELIDLNENFIKNGAEPYVTSRKIKATKAEASKQNAQFSVVTGLINDKNEHTYEDSSNERTAEEIFKNMFW